MLGFGVVCIDDVNVVGAVFLTCAIAAIGDVMGDTVLEDVGPEKFLTFSFNFVWAAVVAGPAAFAKGVFAFEGVKFTAVDDFDGTLSETGKLLATLPVYIDGGIFVADTFDWLPAMVFVNVVDGGRFAFNCGGTFDFDDCAVAGTFACCCACCCCGCD